MAARRHGQQGQKEPQGLEGLAEFLSRAPQRPYRSPVTKRQSEDGKRKQEPSCTGGWVKRLVSDQGQGKEVLAKVVQRGPVVHCEEPSCVSAQGELLSSPPAGGDQRSNQSPSPWSAQSTIQHPNQSPSTSYPIWPGCAATLCPLGACACRHLCSVICLDADWGLVAGLTARLVWPARKDSNSQEEDLRTSDHAFNRGSALCVLAPNNQSRGLCHL